MKVVRFDPIDKLFPEVSPASAALIGIINGSFSLDVGSLFSDLSRSTRMEAARIVQAVNVGKMKKSFVVGMSEHGTKYQRKLAKKALKKL